MRITQKMSEWYEERTKRHIELVQKYCRRINAWNEMRYNYGFELITDPSFGVSGISLPEISLHHDQSKFFPPERHPYIFITWQYKCKDDGKEFQAPTSLKTQMAQATFHHVKNNAHHPEYWDDNVRFAPREGRDDPTKWTQSDASQMPDVYIAEMVADWMAMSEEKGTSAKDWADQNVNVRWKFTETQRNLIYELIQNVPLEA